MNKDKIKILLGVFVSAGLLLWIYSICDWSKVWRDLQEVNYWVFIPVTVFTFIQFILRTWRWHFLLPRSSKASFRDLFDSIMLGNFASYILPLRAGEFVRPFVLTQRASLSFPRSFVSVVIERFFDLATVLITFALIVKHIPHLPIWVEKGAAGLNLLAFMILAFILCSIFLPEFLEKIIDRVFKFAPKKIANLAKNISRDMISGSLELQNFKNLSAVFILTILVWVVTYFQYYLCLMIFPEPASLTFAISTAVLIALGVAAPSVPGFIGVFQAACFAAFAAFGRSEEQAAVFGLLTHIHHYIFVIVVGVAAMLRFGLRFGDLGKSRAKHKHQEA